MLVLARLDHSVAICQLAIHKKFSVYILYQSNLHACGHPPTPQLQVVVADFLSMLQLHGSHFLVTVTCTGRMFWHIIVH